MITHIGDQFDQGGLNGNGPGYCKMDCSGLEHENRRIPEIVGGAIGGFFGTVMVTALGVLAWKYSLLQKAAYWYLGKAGVVIGLSTFST